MVGIRDIPGRFLCLVGLKSPVFSTILLTPGQGVSSPLMLDSGQVNRLQPARQENRRGRATHHSNTKSKTGFTHIDRSSYGSQTALAHD